MALNNPGLTDIRLPSTSRLINPLCRLIRSTEHGLRRCMACDRRHFDRAVRLRRPVIYTCHAGFLDMALPLMADGRHVATISCGQVLSEPPSEAAAQRLHRRLHWLSLTAAEFRVAYHQAPYLSRTLMRDAMRLLELFAGQLMEHARCLRALDGRLVREDIRRGREFIEREFRDPTLSLARVAAWAGLSAAHFSHLFHRITGHTVTRFLQARRVQEVRRLLETTNHSITRICFDCGFGSLGDFNRVFRRHTGWSPSQHRRRCKTTGLGSIAGQP